MESWLPQLLGSPDIAQSFASAGVPPPSLGESLEPLGGPYGGSPASNPNLIPAGQPGSMVPPAGSAAQNPFLASLRGMQAPAAPKPPEVGTPAAPRSTGRIDSGGLQQLLLALNPGARAAGSALPASLLQAIGGGR